MKEFDVIKKPLVTEKVLAHSGDENHKRYTFVVDLRADKPLIRSAVEQLFKVHVTDINTSVVRGKNKRIGRSVGRRSNWKKAMVTLKPGEKIELFEGV